MKFRSTYTVDKAYQHCRKIVSSHYENFPVASLILPRKLRNPIAAIYAFARSADDFADEGDFDAKARLKLLSNYEHELNLIRTKQTSRNAIFIALAHTINYHNLPLNLFEDLLTAFKQDVTTTRYKTFADVLQYCRNSANPIGRLLLHLTKNDSGSQLLLSDSICSALQLINFYQDISQDFTENNRIYIPQDEMLQFNVTESHIKNRISDKDMAKLFQLQVSRATKIMLDGSPLGQQISGRFGFQLRLMIAGGLQICTALTNSQSDCFSRPRLSRLNWLKMLKYALVRR